MNIHIVLIDMSKPEEMLDRTKEALRIFGRIDTLILCTKTELNKSAAETTLEEAQKIMEANFWANVSLTKAVLPILKRQGQGHILVFNPIVGKIGTASQSAFSASRHALYGYFDSLRAEQSFPIYITMVLGNIGTTKKAITKFFKNSKKHPEEIILNSHERKLPRLKFFRSKAFFKKQKAF
jgi:short-subunit dehydrogenase